MSALEDGRLPNGTGLSQAEPKVSALRASIPDAWGVLTLDQVRELLLADAARFIGKRRGSLGLNQWGRAHGVPRSRVSEVLAGKRLPNPAILSALGLEWQIVRRSAVTPAMLATALHENLCQQDIIGYLDADIDCDWLARAVLEALAAQGIDTRSAATTGAVGEADESPVAKPCAQSEAP